MYYNEDSKILNAEFLKACIIGNLSFVKEYINIVDINCDFNAPMICAVKNGHYEIVKLLLSHPNIHTDFKDIDVEISVRKINGVNIIVKNNPFLEAIMQTNYKILDLFIIDGRMDIYRIKYLDMLENMKDEELNAYFMKLNDFVKFVLQQGEKYINLISQQATDIFLF